MSVQEQVRNFPHKTKTVLKKWFLAPSQRKKKYRRRVYALIALMVIFIGLFSYLTNPFVRFSIIIDPYHTISEQEGQFLLSGDRSIIVKEDAFFRRLAVLKSGWHIVGSRFTGGPKSKNTTIDEIIREIHELRFNPELPFLISGDHFSMLYPRSLGIFYHSILDPRTALDQQDWNNRQLIYLKTTAYALQVFQESDRLSTTVTPIGPRSVALLNFYAPPSDTLYSLLYALQVLQDEYFLKRTYPFFTGGDTQYPLQTRKQAIALLETHKAGLTWHYNEYRRQVFDESTGLIRKNISISSTKDIARRQSAFYDNVIFWRTTQMAQELGVIPSDPVFLSQMKERILSTYWLENEGYFLEDLSQSGVQKKYYSSDWLIVQMTGFLDPRNPVEREYFTRSVQYIQRNAIDQPFGLQYQSEIREDQLTGVAGLLAPEYGATAIWSNWGMEYIKLLIHLAQTTGDEIYLQQADQQLNAYAYNIKRYRGYPEVYDENGDFFRQTLYKSVRKTGWVVSYEQARAMYDWTRENWAVARR